jgi:hypothetical protein
MRDDGCVDEDDRYREALRAHLFEHEPLEAIERRLGIPFDETTVAEFLESSLAQARQASSRPIEEPLPESFITRDGLDVSLHSVAAEEVIAAWRSRLSEAPISGRWPVILSSTHPSSIRDQIEIASDSDLPPASELIEQAKTLDARLFLDQARQQATQYDTESSDRLFSEQAPSRPLPPVPAPLIPTEGHATIGLFPCNNSYEIPAILAYGGWNGSPTPSEHVAILWYWQDLYNARLQALSDDTLELAVGQPPKSAAVALAIARDHFSYADISHSLGMYPNVGALASVLPGSDHWHFWWD